ncbi:MAG: hypothetical protein K1X57_10640 [Gemmataceae bacterium]|nr:hypothetical protein [Gemmataceae bacterium]
MPATISYTAEALRLAANPPKPEEKISVFWRVFGGTILSITALVCIQAYQSLMSSLHEVRADQNRMRDAAADFVKKDEFSSRSSTLWNRVQELQSLQSSVTVASSKLTAAEAALAAAERERKELLASVAAEHKEVLTLVATVHGLKDKDALLEKKLGDAETERKELLKELQALRERLAKLEGQAQPTTTGKTNYSTRF